MRGIAWKTTIDQQQAFKESFVFETLYTCYKFIKVKHSLSKINSNIQDFGVKLQISQIRQDRDKDQTETNKSKMAYSRDAFTIE